MSSQGAAPRGERGRGLTVEKVCGQGAAASVTDERGGGTGSAGDDQTKGGPRPAGAGKLWEGGPTGSQSGMETNRNWRTSSGPRAAVEPK